MNSGNAFRGLAVGAGLSLTASFGLGLRQDAEQHRAEAANDQAQNAIAVRDAIGLCASQPEGQPVCSNKWVSITRGNAWGVLNATERHQPGSFHSLPAMVDLVYGDSNQRPAHDAAMSQSPEIVNPAVVQTEAGRLAQTWQDIGRRAATSANSMARMGGITHTAGLVLTSLVGALYLQEARRRSLGPPPKVQ